MYGLVFACQEYIIEPVSNYSHTAEDVSTNLTPDAFLREVAVHNPYDANASWVRVVPLFGEDTTGIMVADNGEGVTRAVGNTTKN